MKYISILALIISMVIILGCEEDSNVVQSVDLQIPETVIDFKTFVISDSELLLTWKDMSENETGFQIEQSIGNDNAFSLLGTAPADEDSFTVTDIDWQTPRYYRIRAVNDDGSSDYTAIQKVVGIRQLNRFTEHNDPIWSIDFSPDGNYLATGSWDNKIKIWDISANDVERTIRSGNDFWDIAYNSTGDKLISAGGDRKVTVWDVTTGRALQNMVGHYSPVRSVAISSDENHLASGSGDEDYPIKIWNPNDGSLLDSLTGHAGAVLAMEFSPDDQILATGSIDNTLKLWSVSNGFELSHTVEDIGAGVLSLNYNDNGQILAVGTGYPHFTVFLIDPQSGTILQSLEGHTDDVLSVDISPNGQQIASGSLDGTVKVWDMTSGDLLQTLFGHDGGVTAVSFSNNGEIIVSGSEDYSMIFWGP